MKTYCVNIKRVGGWGKGLGYHPSLYRKSVDTPLKGAWLSGFSCQQIGVDRSVDRLEMKSKEAR
jgi:hypothetical protein